MLIQTLRPQTFEEVRGQELPKKVLKAIVNSPNEAPRSILIHGPYGTGKTTLSRVFARALNCEHPVNGNPCGKCANCKCDIDSAPFYSEYDSAIIGNVETIKDLRDTFYTTIPNGVRIIVLDESHLASRQAQSSLLKVLEEAPKGVIFIFPTTHPDSLLPTIRSRSLEIRVTSVPRDSIIEDIMSNASKLGISITNDTANLIALKSKGHMRNAHMMLDQLRLIGEEDFKKSLVTARVCLCKYMMAMHSKNTSALFSSVKELMTFPLAEIKDDFDNLLLDLTHNLVAPVYDDILPISKAYQSNILKIVKVVLQDWFQQSFASDIQLQAALYSLYQMYTSQSNSQPNTPVNRNAKR